MPLDSPSDLALWAESETRRHFYAASHDDISFTSEFDNQHCMPSCFAKLVTICASIRPRGHIEKAAISLYDSKAA